MYFSLVLLFRFVCKWLISSFLLIACTWGSPWIAESYNGLWGSWGREEGPNCSMGRTWLKHKKAWQSRNIQRYKYWEISHLFPTFYFLIFMSCSECSSEISILPNGACILYHLTYEKGRFFIVSWTFGPLALASWSSVIGEHHCSSTESPKPYIVVFGRLFGSLLEDCWETF